jgi:hypothetical protein
MLKGWASMQCALLISVIDQCRINTICATADPLNAASEYDRPGYHKTDFKSLETSLRFGSGNTNRRTTMQVENGRVDTRLTT